MQIKDIPQATIEILRLQFEEEQLKEMEEDLAAIRRAQVVEKEIFPNKETGFYKFITDKVGKTTFIPQYYEYANYIIHNHSIICEQGQLWKYDRTHYVIIFEPDLDQLCMIETAENVKPNHLSNFNRILKGKSRNRKASLKSTKGFINLNNGILDISKRTINFHNKMYFFPYKLNTTTV